MNRTEEKVKLLKQLAEELLVSDITHGLSRSLRSLKKEISTYSNHVNTELKHKAAGKFKNVQIGGGKHLLEGFLNIDVFEPADVIYDLREGMPLEDASVNFLFSEHFMEHIDYPKSTKKFAKECFRVIEKGGSLVIGVPDGEKVIKGYIKKDEDLRKEYMEKWYSNRNCKEDFNTYIDLVNYHFRDQDDDEKYNPHFWDYDFEKLKDLFLNAGFSSVDRWKFDNTIANPKREFGSIYIIARKI